jgi:thiosulfate dehydrogenase
MKWLRSFGFLLLSGSVILLIVFSKKIFHSSPEPPTNIARRPVSGIKEWQAPDIRAVYGTPEGALIVYGQDLFVNTSKYFGKKGSIAVITNGMNCGNCHIDGGTRPFGNCLSAVAANYPMYRSRSGIIESIEFRINDCFLRSLNGTTIDSGSKEMQAMVAYLKWLGKEVPLKTKPKGAGLESLPLLDRAADTMHGRIVFNSRCIKCHGQNGQGKLSADTAANTFTYPPLWGPNSFNTGAGLYRIGNFAAFIKNNMPYGDASHDKPVLANEEAWDVAAYVNSQPRPVKNYPQDWPDISKKPFDFPYGPYKDSFPETQHKYGPFKPIKEAIDKMRAKKIQATPH